MELLTSIPGAILLFILIVVYDFYKKMRGHTSYTYTIQSHLFIEDLAKSLREWCSALKSRGLTPKVIYIPETMFGNLNGFQQTPTTPIETKLRVEGVVFKPHKPLTKVVIVVENGVI